MEDYKAAIKAHALGDFPREACGIVVKTPSERLLAIRLPNSHPQPEKSFLVHPSAFKEALQNPLVYVYHSHPYTKAVFSPADVKMIEDTGYAGLVYSVLEDAFAECVPSGIEMPLEGRHFCFGVFDCVTLVNDYYRKKFNVKFPLHLTSLSDITVGVQEIDQHIIDRNLSRVDNPKEGDIILMSLTKNQRVSHCAIYLGDGLMLHQLINRTSCKEVYGGHWKNATVCFLRHPNNTL